MTDYLYNVNRRKEINTKWMRKEKVTKEDREWCAINPTYNDRYGDSFYHKDIITLLPKQNYSITIEIESAPYGDKMIPTIGVAHGKGKIWGKTIDQETREEVDFETKYLGVCLTENKPIYSFNFVSQLGYLCVEYKCEYFDEISKVHVRAPSILNYSYAMRKEIVGDNKIRYFCKHAKADKDDFTALTFTIAWDIV